MQSFNEELVLTIFTIRIPEEFNVCSNSLGGLYDSEGVEPYNNYFCLKIYDFSEVIEYNKYL